MHWWIFLILSAKYIQKLQGIYLKIYFVNQNKGILIFLFVFKKYGGRFLRNVLQSWFAKKWLHSEIRHLETTKIKEVDFSKMTYLLHQDNMQSFALTCREKASIGVEWGGKQRTEWPLGLRFLEEKIVTVAKWVRWRPSHEGAHLDCLLVFQTITNIWILQSTSN